MISRPPALHDLVCDECHLPFQAARAHAHYCSDACKQAHYRHTKNSGLAQKHDTVIRDLDALENTSVTDRNEIRQHLQDIRDYIDIMIEENSNDE